MGVDTESSSLSTLEAEIEAKHEIWSIWLAAILDLFTFDLIFRGQDLIPRVNNYLMSSYFVIPCILTPISSIYHVLLLKYNFI